MKKADIQKLIDNDDWELNAEDERIDELYRPKKSNSRKSLLPLFVYLILEKYSSEDRPLRQQEIIDLLAHPPFEICVERKALSRTIHALADSDLHIHFDSSGAWMNKLSF